MAAHGRHRAPSTREELAAPGRHRSPKREKHAHRAPTPPWSRESRQRALSLAVVTTVVAAAMIFGGTVFLGEAPSTSVAVDRSDPASSSAPAEASSPAADPSPANPEPPPAQPTASAEDPIGARDTGPGSVEVPESASGDFDTAPGRTEREGVTRTYAVQVERGLPFDVGPVAKRVDRILSDPRGWSAGGFVLARRPAAEASLTIMLASPETTDRLCAPLLTGGRLSCRNGNRVVLNAWRWANGTPDYGDDLTNYRRYLVNHEVGHALGFGHVPCPGAGEPAPVMMQQTKGLLGCAKNPWPAEVDLQ